MFQNLAAWRTVQAVQIQDFVPAGWHWEPGKPPCNNNVLCGGLQMGRGVSEGLKLPTERAPKAASADGGDEGAAYSKRPPAHGSAWLGHMGVARQDAWRVLTVPDVYILSMYCA